VQVLTFGTYDERSHPRIGVLASGLRAHGHTVTSCNVPLGLDTAARVALLRQPWRLPLLVFRLGSCWLRLAARARRGTRPDVVLVGYLGHFDVLLARALFPRTPVVLDQLVFAADTAADRGVTTGLRPRLLRMLDQIACSAADLVIVDTEENASIAPPGTRTLVVAVGAPEAWEISRSRSCDGPLRAIFFGLFTPLQGAVTIAAAGALLDPSVVALTLVGRGQDLDAARRAARGAAVTWIEWVDSSELPAMVADHDVCLGIVGTTPKALRVVPNKVFQGAAAGCAVVTSDTPPQRRLLGDAAVYVHPGDAPGLAAALTALAADRARCADLGAAAASLAAAAFTPLAVTVPLAAALPDLIAEKRHA
jgi:glycosyltransferase involved in cell wall biosynthesis